MSSGWSKGLSGFNTQPPEGGWVFRRSPLDGIVIVSTHSRLKAAGSGIPSPMPCRTVSTHSRLKAAGNQPDRPIHGDKFQHTAA